MELPPIPNGLGNVQAGELTQVQFPGDHQVVQAPPHGSPQGQVDDPTNDSQDHCNDLIFVSIASYRDPQLLPTIADCLAKAAHPERLRFGICWQHGAEEAALPWAGDPRFRILDVDWRNSRGACWARASIMDQWQGEAWFLQVDSHCRFAAGWDSRMIVAAAATGSARPLLSTYASPFTPADNDNREILAGNPQKMAIGGFTPEGLPQLKPIDIADWRTRSQPLRARFLAAGFLFTIGAFVREVGYDPELYFFGEEIAMTLRAYTHGYDLFHPHELLVWHDYVRRYATRHWEDHTPGQAPSEVHAWDKHDARSRDKVIRLLQGQSVDSFGLGTARTLADYEQYAGLSFASRKMQDYTRRSEEPPNPPAKADWQDHIYPWIVRILIDPARMSPAAFRDQNFWYVTLQDEQQNEIYRHDFPAAELEPFTGSESRIALVCELESGIIPATWTVWPVSRTLGWLSKLHGKLEEGDYAIVHDDPAEKPEPENSAPQHPGI